MQNSIIFYQRCSKQNLYASIHQNILFQVNVERISLEWLTKETEIIYRPSREVLLLIFADLWLRPVYKPLKEGG